MISVRSILFVTLAGAASGMGLRSPAAFGQPASATAPTVEVIVVTARKREEPLLEVPISVSAFTAERIEDLRLVSLNDVARHTPGFSFASATGRQPASDRPTIRGLTTIRNGIANSRVAASFIDGIYVGGSLQPTDLYNLERVEIIRGPQAAQFGRGTYAGAINYITRAPSAVLAGEVSVTGGEHDTFDVAGWLSGPLIEDRLALFVAADHRSFGGEYTNLRDGSSVGGEESNDITAKLYWTPSATVDVGIKIGRQETDDEHFPIYLQPRSLNNCCFRSADAPRAREYYVGEAQALPQVILFTDLLESAGGAGTRLDRALAMLDIRWTPARGYAFTSLTGYVGDESTRGFDASYAAYDPLPFSPGSFTLVDSLEQTDVSQEFRLSSPAQAALRWTAGVYYYNGTLKQLSENRAYLDPNGLTVVAPSLGALAEDEVENTAIFGSVEWDIDERWTAGAELRFARDRIGVTTYTNDGTRAVLDRFRETFSSATPRFTLTYRADNAINYYASIAKGTSPGDFNADVPALPDGSPDESFRAVDEEELWSYELGVKGRWWDDRANGSIAGYYLDVENQQLTQLVELANGTTASIIGNVGRTEVYGLESELSLRVSERVSLRASYAYTRAEYREHISIEEADLRGSDGSFAENSLLGDVAGHRLPRVPEHMASLELRYETAIPGGHRFYLNADATYESAKYAQEHNLIETGGQTLVGLVVGLDVRRWSCRLWVRNLLDDDTPDDILRYFDRRSGTLPAFPQQGPTPPSSSPRAFAIPLPRGRQGGATLSYRF
jgi:outer membrane receptor protein involved in Fe transport